MHTYPPGAVLVSPHRDIWIIDRTLTARIVYTGTGRLRHQIELAPNYRIADINGRDVQRALVGDDAWISHGCSVDVSDTAKGLALLDYVMGPRHGCCSRCGVVCPICTVLPEGVHVDFGDGE